MDIKSSTENCVEVDVIFPTSITSFFISEEQLKNINIIKNINILLKSININIFLYYLLLISGNLLSIFLQFSIGSQTSFTAVDFSLGHKTIIFPKIT